MPKPLIFWGAAGQAKVLRDCLLTRDLKLVALFDNNPQIASPFTDVPLYYGEKGFRTWNRQQTEKPVFFLVAIGGNRGKERLQIQGFLEAEGLRPLTAIHDTACVSSGVYIGAGSQILAGSIISVDVHIGKGCIVNTGALVDHECYINDGVHICPGAHLAGEVKIEKYVMVGTGAVVLPRISISEGAIIGAGAIVTRDVPAYTMVAGNPARIVRRLKSEL